LTLRAATVEPNVAHVVVEPPTNYRAQYERLCDELGHRSVCYFCNASYTSADIGSLSCTFHPMSYYARCERALPYAEIEAFDKCTVCVRMHVPEANSKPVAYAQTLRRFDCTRIDHTARPFDLFDRVVVAIPTFMASKLALFYRTGGAPSLRDNVLLVDEPSQLESAVVFGVPGAGEFRHDVRALYDCMACKFRLQALDDALREARTGTKETASLSSRVGAVDDRIRVLAQLYSRDERKVTFVPFYLVARIEQRPKQMRFELKK